jgi:hypothetical protein
MSTKPFSTTSQHPINNYSAMRSPDSTVYLQQTIGNQVVQMLMRSNAGGLCKN